MNWLDRARNELGLTAGRVPAISDDRNLTALLAVPRPENSGLFHYAGSSSEYLPTASSDDFEERAAILEFEAGFSRDAAERLARRMVNLSRKIH